MIPLSDADKKERKRIYDAEYRAKFPEKLKERGIRYRTINKDKIKEKKKVEFSKNREKYRKGWHRNVLRWRFGITFEQYQKILSDQGGVCKICKKFRLSRQQRRMGVDHCHKTGTIRGILCDWCNHGLGRFEDDTILMAAAIEYLKDNGSGVDIGEVIDVRQFSPKTRGLKRKMNTFISNTCFTSFVNLDHRPDRLTNILSELNKAGIHADRTRGILPKEVDGDLSKYRVMLDRTPGALGCYLSQIEIMKDALSRRKNAFIIEDDVIFCSDIQDRFKVIQDFLDKNEWDVFFLGGTVHTNPPWWHKPGHSTDLKMCNCSLSKDAERTEFKYIFRVYGAFSTHAYIVNKNSIEKIIKYFDENVHLSMGIDWLFIKMQPQIKAFMFLPGCAKQMDNMSDIGNGVTVFSGFSMLGPYWWTDKMDQFDPDSYNWGEAG